MKPVDQITTNRIGALNRNMRFSTLLHTPVPTDASYVAHALIERMSHHRWESSMHIRSLVALFALLGALAIRSYAAEPALATAAKDPQIKWGACPEFMPKECRLAVLHGDPGKPNADAFLKIPAGALIPEHWHTSAERMILVAGEMQVTYRGQSAVTLRPGMYAYGPPKHLHSGSCNKGGEDCVLFIAFEAPIDAHPVESGST
jgi:quercetin dioxygenase-like cupin family protein